jgi:hypothetical protein
MFFDKVWPFRRENIMRKGRTEAVLPFDTMASEYEKEAVSESKEEKQTKSTAMVIASERVQERGSALGAEEETIEDIGALDVSEINELIEFTEADESFDNIPYRSEEEDDFESVRRLHVNPKYIVRKVKRNAVVGEGKKKEEQRPRSRWFLTTCCYCGETFRFRSDEPQPPTCGEPQCIARFEERTRREAAAVTGNGHREL